MPLAVHPTNSRYFTADGGQTAILLSGSHIFPILTDVGSSGFPPPAIDWQGFIDDIAAQGHTYVRFWMRPRSRSNALQANDYWAPLPWARTGPGTAADGELKFDLTTFDSTYFTRMRERIQYCAGKGIYVSVMLFNPLGAWAGGTTWDVEGHPFGSTNNINGIAVTTVTEMKNCFTLASVPTGVLAVEEAYVHHVLDTVEDLPNVMIEIANELPSAWTGTGDWQEHWINDIHTYEAANSTYQHLVIRSADGGGGGDDDSTAVLASNADVISPDINWTGYSITGRTPGVSYGTASVAVAGSSKPSIYDTDHTYGFDGGPPDVVWKAFTRGHHIAYLDDYFELLAGGPNATALSPNIATRAACGHVAQWSQRVTLADCTPSTTISSTTYALANATGHVYIVYQPGSGAFTVDLSGSTDVILRADWLDVTTGDTILGPNLVGGSDEQSFTPPYSAGAALLLTRRTRTIANEPAVGVE